jgi:PAS domain S-box-containing protein
MRPETPRWRLDRAPLSYVFSVAVMAAAILLTLAVKPLLQQTVLALYLAALIITAWYAGVRPSIVALLLAVVATDLWIIQPFGTVVIGSLWDAIPLVVLIGMGLLIIAISSRARSSEDALRVHATELAEQAAELEQQMESTQALQVELELANDQLEGANRALEVNREFLEEAQRTAHLGSWDWDIRNNVVSWSDELYRLYGMEPGSQPVSFETYLAAVHPDDREMVALQVRRALEDHQLYVFDHRALNPDGSVRWIEGRGRVVLDDSGTPVRMVGSGQDVTARRRASDAQRFLAEAGQILSSDLDYRLTLKNIADLAVRHVADWCAIAIGDETGRHENIAVAHRDPARVKWAEEWAMIHPPRFDNPTGVSNVLRTRRSELHPSITPELLAQSGASNEELRVIRELGLRSVMVVPMVARDRIVGAITFISAESAREFTRDDLWLAERLAGRAALAIDNARLFEEARDARDTAEQANRAKMDFLAAMSHEFRTPLNAIAGYAQLLEIGLYGELTPDQREVLGRLQRSQHHLLGLVEQVLGFARVEAGKLELQRAEVVVNEVIAHAAEMMTPQLQAKSLEFVCEFDDPSVRVWADEERLQQILVNLLTNAVKFTGSGGHIRINCEVERESVCISVADTGVGIPPDKLETVFEPFAQLPQPREKRSSGVGLGLAIARDLARAMGGDLTAASAVGKGSVFSLTLPRV